MKKKILALSLSLAIAFTSLTPTVLATDLDDVQAIIAKQTNIVNLAGDEQQEILSVLVPYVRNLLQIPENVNYFYSNYWYDLNRGSEFNLQWQTDNAFWNVSIRPNGELLSYNHYVYNSGFDDYRLNEIRFPKIDQEEAVEIALQWLKEKIPQLRERITMQPRNISYYRGGDYSIEFGYNLDGIPLASDGLNISVNASNGMIRNFYRNDSHGLTFANIEDTENIISLDEATEAAKKNLGLQMYYSTYDYNNYANELTEAKLYYAWHNVPDGYFFDAKSGELFAPPLLETILATAGMAKDNIMVYGKGGETAYSEARLSPEEMTNIAMYDGVKTADEAFQVLLSYPELGINDSYSIIMADYSRSYNDEKQINLSMGMNSQIDGRQIYLTMDATTGDISNFDAFYFNSERKEAQIDIKKAEEIIESFVKRAKADLWESLGSPETRDNRFNYTGNEYFRFPRQENGILVQNEFIFGQVDLTTGYLSAFGMNWTNNIKFPEPKQIITEENAFAALFDEGSLELSYLSIYNEAEEVARQQVLLSYNAKLIYTSSNLFNLLIDAFTGEVINARDNSKVAFAYTDLEGHEQAEQIIKVLSFLAIPETNTEDKLFRPMDIITQEDWLKWIFSLMTGYTNPYGEVSLSIAQASGILKASEVEPEAKMGSLDCLDLLLRFTPSYRYLSNDLSVFVNPLNLEPQQATIVALASGLEMIDISTFIVQTEITRAEAAMMLYNYLSR